MRKIKPKTYTKYFTFLLVVTSLAFVMSKLYLVHQTELLKKSVLENTISKVEIGDIQNTIDENEYGFILISYVNSKEIRDVEKNIKELISRYNLANRFYYLDASELRLKANYLDDINAELGSKITLKVEEIPCIVYFKKKNVVKVLDSSDGVSIDEKLKQLIDNYEIVGK